MVDINQVFTANTFKGEELQGDEPVLTIKHVDVKDFGDGGKKLVLHFLEDQRTLVCNKTNSKKIAKAFGNETAQWGGKRIQLYFDEDVEYGGKTVGGIRVRTGKKPAAQKPASIPEFDDRVDDVADTF